MRSKSFPARSRARRSSPASRSAKPSWSRPRAPASWPRSCRPACAPSRRRFAPETGAGGFILPNDRVDVILTRRDGEAEKRRLKSQTSETILTNVRVLAIDQTVEEKNGQKVVIGKTATLELTPARRPKRSRCRSSSARCRSRCAASPTRSQKPTTTEDTRRGGVNIVRFGVGTTTTPK